MDYTTYPVRDDGEPYRFKVRTVSFSPFQYNDIVNEIKERFAYIKTEFAGKGTGALTVFNEPKGARAFVIERNPRATLVSLLSMFDPGPDLNGILTDAELRYGGISLGIEGKDAQLFSSLLEERIQRWRNAQ